VAVGATGTGGINARAKSLGRAESGLKGFRAGLAHIKGEMGPSPQVPAVGEGCLTVETLPSLELIGLSCSNSGGC